MSTKNFCDVCLSELQRNMVTDPLIVTFKSRDGGEFTAKVIVSKNGGKGDGDLCYETLMKELTKPPVKPKRKYERKPKVEPTAPPPVEPPRIETLSASKKKGKKEQKVIPILELSEDGQPIAVSGVSVAGLKRLPDISTFSVKTGLGDEPHFMSLGNIGTETHTLRQGADYLLATLGIDQAFVENAPFSEGKRFLLSILKEDKKETEPKADWGIRGG